MIAEQKCITCPHQEECLSLKIFAEEITYNMGDVFYDPDEFGDDTWGSELEYANESATARLMHWVKELTYKSLCYAYCMGRAQLDKEHGCGLE